MEKEWKKLIDDVVDDRSYSAEPHSKFVDFLREKTTIEDKRAIVKDVERRVKKVVNREENNPDWFFRNFSDTERDLLDDLLGLRKVTLDEMMLHPTAAEIERLGKLNEKLYKLTLECFEQCRNLWLTLYRSPYKVNDRFCYNLDSSLRFEYADKDSVLHLENDDYYGSDFDYMIHLTDELISTGHCYMDTIVNGACANFFGTEQEMMRELTDTLDDGMSWAEGYLHNKTYDHLCICYAMHALHTHQPWCLPDILRMADFTVKVELKYERNVSEQRDLHCPDENDNDSRWPEGVPCLDEK